MLDLVLHGGLIVDGLGGEPYKADVGTVDDQIVAIGDLDETPAHRSFDVKDSVVAPGFIDLHGHSDLSLMIDGAGSSKLQQGVTTEVVGNCGMSAAPYVEDSWILGLSTKQAVHASGCAPWTDLSTYIGQLEKRGIAYNVCPLVGLGSVVRAGSQGSEADPRSVVEHIHEALEHGAHGVSMGLYYQPDASVPAEVLQRIAEAASAEDVLLSVHIRDESDFSVGLANAIEEVLELATVGSTRLQISHLKAIGPGGWSQLDTSLGLIESALSRGLDVAADQYPYLASETALNKLAGLPQEPVPTERDAAIVEETLGRRGGASQIVVSHCDLYPEVEGANLADIASLWNAPLHTAIRKLTTAGETTALSFVMRPEDIERIMAREWVAIGSDGVGTTPSVARLLGKQHPRSYGTFPKVLGKYVREKSTLTLHDAVRRMTSLPAQRLKLSDRGRVEIGAKADLVVFDPGEVRDTATFEAPDQPPLGITHVMVNGTPAVVGGQQLDVRPGKVLAIGS